MDGDSEAAPRKVVPLWAQWDQVSQCSVESLCSVLLTLCAKVDAAMEVQEDVEPLLVFGECGAPDLTLMFGPRCRRGSGGEEGSGRGGLGGEVQLEAAAARAGERRGQQVRERKRRRQRRLYILF